MLGALALAVLAQAVMTAPLPKDEIAKVIAEHKAQLAECNLNRRVMVSFRIEADGSVKKASGDDCIVARLKTFRFPQPRGGGVVNVTYPFDFTEVSVDGGELAADPRESILRGVRQHQAEAKKCYEAELQKTPHLDGKVVVQFTVGGDGAVQRAEVTESSLPKSLGDCIVSQVEKWRFAEPAGGAPVTVSFPWGFKAK